MMVALPQSFVRLPLAHRGLHDRSAGRIENAMASFLAAAEAGYGIELDLQLSSDGQAMAFHDYGLDRLTHETGLVRDRTAKELSTITLKDTQDKIPTFAEVLDAVEGRVPLLIEVKDQDGAYGTAVGELEAAAARDLKGYLGECAVMSFNPHSVAVMQTLMPEIPRGLTTDDFSDVENVLATDAFSRLRRIEDFERVGASFISHDKADLYWPRVSELKAAGARVLCWTVRSPAEEAAALSVAENITFEGYLPRVTA